MPIYEYRCLKCEEVFEIIQKFSDDPLKKHQGCGGKVERLLSAPGLQFKGSGWYITDYAKGGSSPASAKKSDSGDSGSSSESKSSESKSSESKPSKSKK